MVIREQTQLYSAEDLWELSHQPEYAEMRLELFEGELIIMPPSGLEHGECAGDMFGFIWNHVRQHNLGRVTAAETGYILHKNPDGKDTILAPDVGFIAAGRLEGRIEKYAPLAPDLAVEVVSPNDTASEVQNKVTTYLKYGTRMVIVLYPTTKQIVVHTKDGARTLNREDTLDGGDVLPGFSLPLKELFRD